MTKKDYEAMAKAFGDALVKNGYHPEVEHGIWLAVHAYMDVAAADNPNFNPTLFYDAVTAHAGGKSITGIQLTGTA